MRAKRGFSPTCALAIALALGAPIAAGCQGAQAIASVAIESIRFAPGTSSAEVDGAAAGRERALYSVGAREGQTLALSVTSVEQNAVFQVYAPGAKAELKSALLQVTGETLKGAGEGDDATRWSGALPRSGDYLIVVGPSRGNATYRLTVSIE